MTTNHAEPFDDLQLINLATHDLVTAVQPISGHLDLLDLILAPAESAAARAATNDALGRMVSMVKRYRAQLMSHVEFVATLQEHVQPIVAVATTLAGQLRDHPSPEARSENLAALAGQLAWVSRASAHLVLGLGDWHTEALQAEDFTRVLESVASLNQARASQKGLDLSVELAQPESVPRVPEWMLRTVVGNLLANAIKYTDRGRVELRSSVREDGRVVVSVTDTGIGMDAETLRTLTQPGVRARQVLAEGREGQGYGLTLAAWAARAVGARLEFSSTVSVGTRAELLLPAGQVT